MEIRNKISMPEAFDAMGRLLKEIVKARDELEDERLWWRGQPIPNKPLQAKIHRNRTLGDEGVEFDLYFNFVREAPVRYPNWPNDRCSQLLLMQHYGLSTRLLDWSMTFLVGLYFAVNKDFDKPGELWALNPRKLHKAQNLHTSGIQIFNHSSPEVKRIVDAAFNAKHRGSNRIIAMSAPLIDLRMFAQWSLFTIHASYLGLTHLEEELQKKFLYKIDISPEEKPLLKQALEIYGISEARLFPDIEKLASYLESKTKSESI